MRQPRIFSVIICAVGIATTACSEDAPVGDPGGQGGPRPDAAGSSEVPAADILQSTGQPAHQDTSQAGAASMAGAIRDSLHRGEAIPGVSQPRPERAEESEPGN